VTALKASANTASKPTRDAAGQGKPKSPRGNPAAPAFDKVSVSVYKSDFACFSTLWSAVYGGSQ
jgi:hypothetical protein